MELLQAEADSLHWVGLMHMDWFFKLYVSVCVRRSRLLSMLRSARLVVL